MMKQVKVQRSLSSSMNGFGKSALNAKRKSVLLAAATVSLSILNSQIAQSATLTWDGGGVGGTDLGVAVNWSSDTLPNGAASDVALFNGTVAGPLNLAYATLQASLTAGPGLTVSLAATQTDSVTIDNTVSPVSNLRFGNAAVIIDAGAGAFTLGDGTGVANFTLGSAGGTTQAFVNNSSNTATISADVAFSLGGGGNHTAAFGGTGNWIINSALATGNLAFAKTGTGTLLVNAQMAATGTTTAFVTGGTLNVGAPLGAAAGTGGIGLTTTTGNLNVNPGSGVTAILNINTTGSVRQGGANSAIGTVAGGTGILNIVNGTVVTGGVAGSQRDLQAGANGFGTINISGATTSVTIGGFVVGGIGAAGAHGIWNISGGAVANSANFAGTFGASANTTGVLNLTGGTYSSTTGTAGSGVFIGEAGAGVLNISGTGVMTLGGSLTTSVGLDLGRNNTATSSGIANLGAVGVGGGTLITNIVRHSGAAGAGTFNFHGGTLQASSTPNPAFMTGLTAAFVHAGTSTIDNNAQNITIGQALLAPTGTGVIAISPGAAGLVTTGYTTAPLVTLSGGTGSGATAVATIDATGTLTGITITNPGNYSVAPTTVTLAGGGKNVTSSTTAFTTGTNTSGGLRFVGSGTTTLSGASTYTGATTVNGGTLNVSGSLAGTAVTVGNTSAATFRASGAAVLGSSGASSLTLTANQASFSMVDGTINTFAINSTAGGAALIVGGSNNFTFETGATSGDQLTLAAGLSTSASGTNTVNINLLARPSATQTLTLISSPGGGLSAANFALGTVTGSSLFGLSNVLNVTSTAVQLVQTAAPAPAVAYFVGDLGTSIGTDNGSFSNFSTDSAGTVRATQLPGAATDVFFYATNANTSSVAAATLDGSITFKTLTVAGGDLGQNAPVGIAQGTGGTLTIAPTNPATGITVNSGAGALTISAPLALGAAQTWTNQSSNTLTVSGPVSGSGNLTVNGPGLTVISGANTSTGTTTVTAGTLQAGIASALSAASPLTISGGTIDVNGFAQTVASLSDGGVNAGTLTNSTGTLVAFSASGAANTSFSGTISGAISINKAGTGSLTLSGTNSYTGITSISGGTIVLGSAAGFGNTSTVTPSNGTTWVIATDDAIPAFVSNIGTGTTFNLVLDRATPGAAINRTLGTPSYGGGQINITQGVNVTSGNATLTYGDVLLSSGSAQTTTFNPTDVTVVLGNVTGVVGGNNHTLGLSGNTTGNMVTGVVANNPSGGGLGGIIKTGAGTWTLTGASTYTGSTTVNTGILVVDGAGTIGNSAPLTVGAGGTLKLATTLAASPKVASLAIAGTPAAPTGTIDVGTKGVVINYAGAVGTILTDATARVNAGRGTANGNGVFAYNAFGITSSAIATSNGSSGFNKFAIGAINNADLTTFGLTAYGTFDGNTVDADSVLIHYTYNGDANLDGTINAVDYDLINRGFAFLIPNVGWLSGDFTGDGVINADDYAVIDFGFLTQGGPLGLGEPVAVPEPASLSVMTLAAASLLKRRRRQI